MKCLPDLVHLLTLGASQVVPMENEQGRRVVEAGALCERKNGRGVDTNRNWQTHWGFREKDYDPAEEYPGTRPFRSASSSCCLPFSCFLPLSAPAARGVGETGSRALLLGQLSRGPGSDMALTLHTSNERPL